MGCGGLNNHQATYFWKAITHPLSLLLGKAHRLSGEVGRWFWVGYSKLSNYKNVT